MDTQFERARVAAGREPPEDLMKWLRGAALGMTLQEIAVSNGGFSVATIARWLGLAGVQLKPGPRKKEIAQ